MAKTDNNDAIDAAEEKIVNSSDSLSTQEQQQKRLHDHHENNENDDDDDHTHHHHHNHNHQRKKRRDWLILTASLAISSYIVANAIPFFKDLVALIWCINKCTIDINHTGNTIS